MLRYYPQAVAGLVGFALIFYLLTGLLIFYKDYTALKDVEEKRAAIRSRASGMLEAKKKLDLLSGDHQALSGFLGRSTMAARVMSSLSTVLPKEAWLISLTVDDKGAIEIEGFTNRTAALIMALEKSRKFRNVSYTAPIITKDGEERFALKLEVAASDQ
jgi:Tfp pilus assembly protein PilN